MELFRIEGKNGKLIEDLSTFPKENEILCQTELTFEVIKVVFSPNSNDYITPVKNSLVVDTEVMALEYFVKKFNVVKGKVYPEVRGELRITSDLCPCPSCSAIFKQFTTMFPGVDLKIITTTKLHY